MLARTLGIAMSTVALALAAALAPAAPARAADEPPAPTLSDVTLPIERGVQHVRAEVAGVQRLGGLPIPAEQVAAQSALTWVQSRLSPAIYAEVGGVNDLRAAFRLQAGLCGDIVEAFMRVLQGVGVRVLPVQFFYVLAGERHNHVAAQVLWGGSWHYVDPTWGVLFEKPGQGVLSPEQVLALKAPSRYALMNRLVPWTDANVRRGGGWRPLGYLTDATERQVVMNGAGSVEPPRSTAGATTTFDLTLMPDYVGTYVPYAHQLVAIEQRLRVPAGPRALVLTTRGKLCGGLGVLTVGTQRIAFADVPDAGELRVALSGRAQTMTVSAGGGDPAEPCAVLLAGARAE
jgi:hypothetical protein